jgi:hypothetical protein
MAILESPQSLFLKWPHTSFHTHNFAWQQEWQWSRLFQFAVSGIHAFYNSELKLILLGFTQHICDRCWKWFVVWAVALSCWKKAYICLIECVFKKMVIRMCVTYFCEVTVSENSGPNNPSGTRITPHTNLNIISWYSMDCNMVLCRPVPIILRIYKSTKLRPGLITIHSPFSPIYTPLKVPVHKITFYSTVCFMELTNAVCYMDTDAISLPFVLRTQISPLAMHFMP